jgi:ABC-type lipoprotein release transport system permease subunit
MVVLMICISLWGLLLMQGVYDGMTEQMISNAIRSDSGHLSLFGHGYRLDPTLANRIKGKLFEQEKLTKLLNQNEYISSWVQRFGLQGLVATAHYSRNTVITGINPEREKVHGRLQRYLVQGEYGFGKKGKGAIIGFKLADKLQVSIGNKIILSAQDANSEVTSIALRVTGILKTNNMWLDETVVFIDIETARKFLGLENGITQVSIMIHDEEHLKTTQDDLQKVLPSVDVMRWDEIYPALMQSRVIMKGFSLVVSLMIFGVAGLGIFGVMLVSVLERIREFGIMLAIGTSFGTIRAIILAESLVMGIAGFLAGAICGGFSLLYFKIYGLDLTVFSEAFDEFGMDAVTYAIIRFDYFITAFAAVVLATLISTYFPLRMLRKSRPVEVINNV